MRIINDIIIHCSASPMGRDDSADDIRRWHRQQGWADIGYHYVVRLDGTVEYGRYVSKAGAHCRGHNAHSIGVCYVGGIGAHGRPCDTRTPAQKSALLKLVTQLIYKYRCRVHGHNEYDKNKDCPCFDVQKEYGRLYEQIVLGDIKMRKNAIK